MLLEDDEEVDVDAETFGYEPVYHHRHVDRRVVDDHEEFEFWAGNRGGSGGICIDFVEGYGIYPEVLQQRGRPHEFYKAAEVGKVAHAELYNFCGRQAGTDLGQEIVLSKDCADEHEFSKNSERGEDGN